MLTDLRTALRRHPCHACNDREEHARWAERRWRLERETDGLRAKVAARTGSLARTFDQVCGLLTEHGYLTDAGAVTDAGRLLSRIWTEADLLVAECVRSGVWDGLGPAELAAAVSVVLYESRRDNVDGDRASVPRGPVADAVEATLARWRKLGAAEADRGLTMTREPDLGFVWPMYRWARGESLAKVLASAHGVEGDMPAGDFVRWARQVLDLLGQLAQLGAGGSGRSARVRTAAQEAVEAVRRGVLAYSAVG